MGSADSPFDRALWGMLIAGGALSLAGLARSYERFWHWRQARALYQGEIIAAAERLRRGQEIDIAPHIDQTQDGPLPAILTETARRSISLEVHAFPDLPVVARKGSVPLPPWMTLGATVNGTFTDEDARYRFEARIQDARSSGRQWHLTLSAPRWLERDQRRSHYRVALSLPATFEWAEGYQSDRSRAATPLPPQHGTLINLSAGGLCAELTCGESPIRAAQLLEQLTPDAILRVRLPIPALSTQSMLVRIRQSEKVIVRGGLGVRVACAFLSMPSWEQELIALKVHEVQSARLRDRRQA